MSQDLHQQQHRHLHHGNSDIVLPVLAAHSAHCVALMQVSSTRSRTVKQLTFRELVELEALHQVQCIEFRTLRGTFNKCIATVTTYKGLEHRRPQ
jgi:hypothetical protein